MTSTTTGRSCHPMRQPAGSRSCEARATPKVSTLRILTPLPHDLAIVWNLGAVVAVDSFSRYLEWASSGTVLRPLRS